MEVLLSPELQMRLARLADEQGRDSQSLVVEAVERMVVADEWFINQVEQGLTQVETGNTLSHEEVGTRLETYLSQRHTANRLAG